LLIITKHRNNYIVKITKIALPTSIPWFVPFIGTSPRILLKTSPSHPVGKAGKNPNGCPLQEAEKRGNPDQGLVQG
jgi:hypothetical protein